MGCVDGQLCWTNASLIDYITKQAKTFLSTQVKNGLFAPFIYKMMILPRQARDKHRETTQKGTVLLQALT